MHRETPSNMSVYFYNFVLTINFLMFLLFEKAMSKSTFSKTFWKVLLLHNFLLQYFFDFFFVGLCIARHNQIHGCWILAFCCCIQLSSSSIFFPFFFPCYGFCCCCCIFLLKLGMKFLRWYPLIDNIYRVFVCLMTGNR